MKTNAYAALSTGEKLEPFTFEHRKLRNNDVAMEVLYCGVCHSDIHMVRNDWGLSTYPIVPGHEIIGRVTEIGSDVKKYSVGDTVAVGCIVDSCQECDQCDHDNEHFCREGATQTYSNPDRIDGQTTRGGYSKHVIAREEFVLRIPDGLDISRAAPLLCAGITTYSPLRNWNVGPGKRVGIVGLGGLGHMAVKLAVGMGAEVTVISRSERKKSDALELGAHNVLISTNDQAMQNAANSFDVIIDTVPYQHDLTPYTPLLDIDGALVLVGQIGSLGEVSGVPLVMGRRQIAGSFIGGIAETQELLNLCGEKNILPECEIINIDQINDAYERLERGDVRYRFVIDMSSLPTV